MPRGPREAVVLFSGGLDSTAVALSVRAHSEPSLLFVDYGQAAAERETQAAQDVATHHGLTLRRLRVHGLPPLSGEITGRNAALVMLALMANPAAAAIVTGIHAGPPYWDCGADFVGSTQRVLDGYTAGETQLLAPFLDMSKQEVFDLGSALDVPVSLTYSCETGNSECGTCPSCLDRLLLC